MVHIGSNVDDKKSTFGGCFYLGSNLVYSYSKEQASISISTVEAEYIATGSCYTQLLWTRQISEDFGVALLVTVAYYHNSTTINISKNLVMH